MPAVTLHSLASSWLWHVVCVRKHALVCTSLNLALQTALAVVTHIQAVKFDQKDTKCAQTGLSAHSVVAGLHSSLSSESSPPWGSASLHVLPIPFSLGVCTTKALCAHAAAPAVALWTDLTFQRQVNTNLDRIIFLNVVYSITECWWFKSAVWKLSVHQDPPEGLF